MHLERQAPTPALRSPAAVFAPGTGTPAVTRHRDSARPAPAQRAPRAAPATPPNHAPARGSVRNSELLALSRARRAFVEPEASR